MHNSKTLYLIDNPKNFKLSQKDQATIIFYKKITLMKIGRYWKINPKLLNWQMFVMLITMVDIFIYTIVTNKWWEDFLTNEAVICMN